MKLELLYFEGCPNWEVAAERLDGIAVRRGLTVERRRVTTSAEAEAAQFRGSPTILIDGNDPWALGHDSFGLACRMYQTPEGPAGSPTTEQLEAAIDAQPGPEPRPPVAPRQPMRADEARGAVQSGG